MNNQPKNPNKLLVIGLIITAILIISINILVNFL